MIGVVMPSRGLVNSRTVEALVSAAQSHPTRHYFSHGRPIPDCFNVPCQEALDDGCEYVVIWEDDVVPPPDFLERQLECLQSADIAFYDANLEQGTATRTVNGIVTSGIGCVMFRAEVLRSLLPLSSDRLYDKDLQLIGTNDGTVYGRQDTEMYVRAHLMGFKAKQAGKADHYHVRAYGNPRDNHGCHDIVAL